MTQPGYEAMLATLGTRDDVVGHGDQGDWSLEMKWDGTGFSHRDLDDLHDRLGRIARETPPFHDIPRADARDAHWVTPRLVGEVEFAEWTRDGRLRQPRWRGWREDKDPQRVRRE